jgi:UDP-2,3-diacylglucosamine pyrophosphatase LpxH
MLQPAPDKRPYIPIAFISDTHLFKENAQTDQLVELLKNVRFGAIFFMGDWEDSLYRDREQRLRGAPPPVPDGVLRVFDILNQKRLEEGTGLFLCPGNHDNGYRALLDPGRQREREEMESLLGMKIIPPFILKTNEGKEYLAFHGDHLDSRFVRHVLYDLGDAMYGVVQKLAGGSAASLAKKFFKLFENVLNLDRRLFHEAERFGTDGTISGHTHLPGHKFVARKGRVIETFNTCFMDGDSIFLAVDAKGGLDLVDWSQRRIELGLDRDPPAVENTGAIYRDLSLKQIFGIMAMKPLPPAQEDRYINLPDPEKILVIRQSDLMKTFARAAENSLPEDAASFTPPRLPMPPEYGQGLAPG